MLESRIQRSSRSIIHQPRVYSAFKYVYTLLTLLTAAGMESLTEIMCFLNINPFKLFLVDTLNKSMNLKNDDCRSAWTLELKYRRGHA